MPGTRCSRIRPGICETNTTGSSYSSILLFFLFFFSTQIQRCGSGSLANSFQFISRASSRPTSRNGLSGGLRLDSPWEVRTMLSTNPGIGNSICSVTGNDLMNSSSGKYKISDTCNRSPWIRGRRTRGIWKPTPPAHSKDFDLVPAGLYNLSRRAQRNGLPVWSI